MLERTQRLLISLTPNEKEILDQLAEFEGGLSLTATVRHLLLQAARERGLVPAGDTEFEDSDE